MRTKIHTVFLLHAATELTDNGLTGSKLVAMTSAYAVDFTKDIPHSRSPFDAPNKRTALFENLVCFEPNQQYQIIRALCDFLDPDGNIPPLVTLKIKLLTEYNEFSTQDHKEEIKTFVPEICLGLSSYPDVKKLFEEALQKYDHGIFRRNTLDDLRLTLEKLLHKIFNNHHSLENQISNIGEFVKNKGGSQELINMFKKLVDYYANYQNTYIKHEDAVIMGEVEFIFELSCSFIKHFLRVRNIQS